ncbi:hypothetical protein IAR55_003055 [Kwoniella newhampshirensis]|uniref:Xeroderma pigmentosum group C-complementing protein n=1 Tax=Kwoniella newhampshirensis TaxID=1651941 RepID=A0AAW0Z079_9TREE
MSASRPKSSKVIRKPPTLVQPSAPVVTPKKDRPTGAYGRPTATGGVRNGVKSAVPQAFRAEVTSSTEKGKGRVSHAPSSVTGSSRPPSETSIDEEDEFEEVPIPDSAGPSSPYPGPGTPTTPGTNLTHGTTPGGSVTTAPSVDDNFNGYGDDESGEGSEEDDGVIHLEIGGETAEEKAKRIALALRKKPMTSKDRALRLEAHKMHVIALLASAAIRNRWCNNSLLKARLLSLLPHPLQSAFNIPPSRFPDRAQRSRLFFDALQALVTWWSQSFFDISDPAIGLRTRPWDEVQEIVDQLPRLTRADFSASSFASQGKGKGKAKEEEAQYLEKLEQGANGERLRSVNSLMKKALQQEGSRDVSAQLFVALARACGLGARLVVSLQAVPWRAEKIVQKKKPGAGRGGRTVASRQGNGPASDDDDEDDEELEEVPIPGLDIEENGASAKKPKNTVRAAGQRRLQDPADLYRLRKVKLPPQKVGTAVSKPKAKVKQDLTDQPPVFWAEIFSRSDQRWTPVDPVRGTIRKKNHFEPTSDSGPIRMLYVVAYEEDGHARDVTLRYTKNFGAKTVKLRVPTRKDEPDWWDTVTGFLQRPYRLNRDELEDAELETSQVSEGMPMHMSGFKDHPIYVLERHLKREEVIQPRREIGRFRGEPVYRRINVLSCKTAENWMRVGRRVKDRQEPLKWVKQRAVTLQKRRAQELAVQESGEAIQQGLYAEYQTETYRPPPIRDGKIPQNSFGNIDLYAPTMLPAGAVHLPYKGIAKVAKSLDVSYADACTGFEFKKQRAIPVISGIVVAKENERMVMEAYEESAAAAEEKERIRREEKALKRWAKLVNGLRVRLRLQAEYGTGEELHEQILNPLADPETTGTMTVAGGKKSAASVLAAAHKQSTAAWAEQMRERSLSTSDEDENERQPSPPLSEKAQRSHTVKQETIPGFEAGEKPIDNHELQAIQTPAETHHDDIQMLEAPPSVRRTKITLRMNGSSGPKPLPPRRSSSRNSKIKAEITAISDEDDKIGEEEFEIIDKPLPPATARSRRGKVTASQAKLKAEPVEGIRRSLRSSAPKSAEQEKQEQERRERLREALEVESDVDMDE